MSLLTSMTVMLIAQLGDMIQWTTLRVLLVVCGCLPAVGLGICAVFRARRVARVLCRYAILYYGLLCVPAVYVVRWLCAAPGSMAEPVTATAFVCVLTIFGGPLVVVVGLFHALLLPALLARRSSAPLCRKCGYDLTGNTSGRCPDCRNDIASE